MLGSTLSAWINVKMFGSTLNSANGIVELFKELVKHLDPRESDMTLLTFLENIDMVATGITKCAFNGFE